MFELGINQSQLARMLGVEPQTIQGWRTRSKYIPSKHIKRVAEVLQTSPNEFFQWRGNVASVGQVHLHYVDAHNVDFDFQQKLGDVATEYLVLDVISGKLFELMGLHSSSYSDYFMVGVLDDNMYPTLKREDVVVMHRMKVFQEDGIYLLRGKSTLTCRRLQGIGNQVQVINDNKVYPPYMLDRQQLQIVGKFHQLLKIEQPLGTS